ncbi:hypothetical protein [Undibacterium griseum]|uniref:Uncharacterized protein n=1 Tax=Undibacterium griseum TaxID=2762295 RepID=A0ABR6YPG3_9BURK|nr:hypothetical protein [Undibacterium griseum]MBC3885791.1 hypothetical protein [Undibacterium griseum]
MQLQINFCIQGNKNMKHSMMRVAVAATLGLSALAANAGQIGVNVGATLAAEYITSAVVVNQPTITFQTANLINDGASVVYHVRFSAGSMKAADGGVVPTSAKAAGAAAADVVLYLNGTATAVANYSVSASTADTDGLGYYFTVSSVAGTGGIPANTVVNILTGNAKIASLTSALGAGGTVTGSVGYTTTAGDFSGVSTWVEAPTTATILTSAKALSQAVKSSGATATGYYTAAETSQVNVNTSLKSLTATTAASAATAATGSTTLINLGATKLAVNTALARPAGGTAAAADFGNVTFAATGDFSVATATAYLASTSDCLAANTTAAGTISTDGKSVSFAAVTPAVATAVNYLCYSVPGTKVIPYNVQYAIGAASVAAQTAAAPNTIASTGTAGNVYLLTSNGASVVVPAFVPSTGTAGNGYNTYLRVINTGNLTSDIYVAAYNSTTGVVGTASKLVSQLPSGGSAMLDTNTVSTALGLTANSWNTLLVTGNTSKLAVQPLLVNPAGVITNLSAVNGGNNAATAN